MWNIFELSDTILRMKMTKSVTIAKLYKFVKITDTNTLQKAFKAAGEEWGIKGTILLAKEGINSTICGSDENVAKMLAFITNSPEMGEIKYQFSYAYTMPFKLYFVKVKP